MSGALLQAGTVAWPLAVLLRNLVGPVGTRRSWLLRLLPDWRLFAPDPVDFDIDVWVRELDAAGQASAPRALRWRRPPGLRFPVFNPESRIDKVVYDLSRQLLAAADDDVGRVQSTAPYRALTSVALQSAAAGSMAQFALCKRTRGTSQLLFCSTWQGPRTEAPNPR